VRILLIYFILIVSLKNVNSQTYTKNYFELIGKTYSNLREIKEFKGFNKFEQALILDSSASNESFTMLSNGENSVILYTRLVKSEIIKILGVLNLGKIEKNLQLKMSTCRKYSKNDGYIIALVKPSETEFHKVVLKAWRLDKNFNQFKEIDTKGIDCINDEYGL
jgi:hypothetical protein